MGYFGRLFLPLFLVLAATGIWLAVEHERDTVFALAPADDGLAAIAPALGPSRAHSATQPAGAPPARERFARPFDGGNSRPRVAVIVTGLGLAREATLRAIEDTPPEVTLAFTPYAEKLAPLVERARAKGHEILLAVPMEPADPRRRDAGPAALAATLTEAAARQRLAWMFGRIHSHVGIVGDLGDRIARDPIAMKPVLDELAARGLVYVANRLEGGETATGVQVASNGVPAAAVSVWLDRELSGDAIDREIAEAEAQARRGGAVVVLAQPYPVTLARIAAWMKAFDRKALVAAPITAVARGGS